MTLSNTVLYTFTELLYFNLGSFLWCFYNMLSLCSCGFSVGTPVSSCWPKIHAGLNGLSKLSLKEFCLLFMFVHFTSVQITWTCVVMVFCHLGILILLHLPTLVHVYNDSYLKGVLMKNSLPDLNQNSVLLLDFDGWFCDCILRRVDFGHSVEVKSRAVHWSPPGGELGPKAAGQSW